MPAKTTLKLLALLASAAGLTACSGHAQPRAVVADAALRETTPEAAVVEFLVETANPNDIELPMRRVSYSLSVDGRRVFSATRDAMATMPRGGTQTITLPAVIPMGPEGVAPGLHTYRLSGRIYYSLPSQLADVLFDARLSRPDVSISDEGEIELP